MNKYLQKSLLFFVIGFLSLSFTSETVKDENVTTGSLISLSASSFNFHDRRVNSLSGFTFDVTNQGSEPLIIYSVDFSSPRFRFDNINAKFPITILPGKSRTLRIWFNPTSSGTFSGTATISSNAANLPNAQISLAGTGRDTPATLGEILWEGNIPDNPLTSYNDYQPHSIKRIDDVNGDGINDVIVATGNYWTICFNGNASVTADTLWKFNTYFGTNNTGSVEWEDAVDIMPDINNDGVDEVVIGCAGGNEMVYALSGATGQKIWQYGSEINNYDGDIMGLRTSRDYNGDNRKDVLISASGDANFTGRHAVICVNGLSGLEIFNVAQNFNFTYDVEAMPNGGAIGVGNNGGPYRVNGFNNSGAPTWNYPITSAMWSIKQIPDINDDSIPDMVGMYGFSGAVFAISGSTGAQLWTASLGNSNNGKIVRLDDKDKNGYIDISLSGPQAVNRIDSRTGTVLWSAPLASSYVRGIDDIGDVNGDTLDDIAVMTQQPGKLFVLDGNDGSVLFQYLFGSSISQRGDRVIAINSIDSNTTKEMVAGCRDGRIKCFSGGDNHPVGISSNKHNIPRDFVLYQNYPNPFNPSTTIKFDLPKEAKVRLVVFDILGREVETIIDGRFKAGQYKYTWDASKYSSGVYFCKLITDNNTDVKKMLVIK